MSYVEKKKIIPIIYNDKNEFSIFYLKSESNDYRN